MENEALWKKTTAMKLIAVTLLIVLLTLSVTVGDKYFSNPEHYSQTLSALDDKEEKVLTLTGSCATAATLLAAVPDDATTPVADEIADLASTFAIELSVIFIEKYSVTLIGHMAFRYLFPLAILLLIAGILSNRFFLKRWAIKLGIFGAIVCFIIPFAMDVSGLIENTADYKIEQTIAEAEEISEEISENTDSEGNFFTKVLEKIKGGITGLMDRANDLLKRMLETAAVLLATACIIPIAVVVVMVWVIKALFAMPIKAPARLPGKVPGQVRGHGRPDDTDDPADE